ncbi:hypothetical protein C0Q70_06341 [Pomacea canaliculata]|uniref:Uncharacterized protein n=1 Tax=Pomacea canaliculata TaxID=400727 RepID=A0A2T7PNS3_POMCA|nr:hypothetical protein C0Q70_06341 [Pomacea canaliculata]
MALIHPKSCESVHSGLDLFSVPPTQTAVEEGSFVEYYPLSAISTGAPIEFCINGATEDYLDLSNTFLHVRAKVTEADGSDLADGKDVAPINYWLHSLFSQVDISLNDTLITSSDNTYPYRAYLEATLNFGSEAKKGHMTAALYYRDSANHLDDTQGDANAGLKIRRDMTAKSKEIDMMGRLHADIMHQERYMLPGVDVKIRLIPSKAAFNLIAHDEDGGYRSTITHASLLSARPNSTLQHRQNSRSTLHGSHQRQRGTTFAHPKRSGNGLTTVSKFVEGPQKAGHRLSQADRKSSRYETTQEASHRRRRRRKRR